MLHAQDPCRSRFLKSPATSVSLPRSTTASCWGSTTMPMPSDIDPKSGFRLPLPNRDDLDEAGKKAYDRGTTPGATIAGLQGPAGVQLFTPKIAEQMSAINRYLRFQ